MVVAGIVVGAAIVGVLTNVATLQFAADRFTADALAADGATKQPACERMFRIAETPILASQDHLTRLEGRARDQRSMLAGIGLPAPSQFADVEAVVKNVREGRTVEPRLAVAIRVSLTLKLIRQRLKDHPTAGIEIEYADHGLGLFRMRLDRLIAVIGDIDVAERSEPRRPALTHPFVHPLKNFGPQTVAVVLGDGSHHIERQSAGGSGTKLILDESQLHPEVIGQRFRYTQVIIQGLRLAGKRNRFFLVANHQYRRPKLDFRILRKDNNVTIGGFRFRNRIHSCPVDLYGHILMFIASAF